MSTEALIPDFPALYYAEGITGATVRGGHTITRATAANIIALGRPARRIGPTQSLGASASYHAGYVRSHTAIKQLALAWYYWPDPDPFATLPTISVTSMSPTFRHTSRCRRSKARRRRRSDGISLTLSRGMRRRAHGAHANGQRKRPEGRTLRGVAPCGAGRLSDGCGCGYGSCGACAARRDAARTEPACAPSRSPTPAASSSPSS